MMITEDNPAALAVSLDEVKAYLRIAHGHEDGLLAGLIRTATGICESFTRQALIERGVVERIKASTDWQRLRRMPVHSVERFETPGGMPLPIDQYAMDIDANGDGWVRANGASGDIDVHYRCGMADNWNAVPEPLRQGIVRLVAHMHLHRDDLGSPPAMVAALWQPWRRMRLS